MKKSLNKVQLIGRLGSDPKLKHTPQGQAVCEFSLATDESYIKKGSTTGEKVNKVEWHRIITWRYNAENAAKYLKKGSLVYLEGKNQTTNFEKDGSKHYITRVVAFELTFLDSKTQQEEPNQSYSSNKEPQQQLNMNEKPVQNNNQQPSYEIPDMNFNEDDLPF